MKFIGSKTNNSDEAVWISSSDLMSGLMVIFLFISVAFIRQQSPAVIGTESFSENYLQNIFNLERAVNDALDKEFSESEKQRWNMEIIPELNLIRFKTPDIMFEQNSTELAQNFKLILAEFFPRYIAVLSEFQTIFKEVRIEGHTSSEWQGANKTDAFIKNMLLSQGRTQQVFQFSMNALRKTDNPIYINFALDKISASGMSSRDLITDDNGVENPELSRRVEFRHIFDDRKYLLTIKGYLSENSYDQQSNIKDKTLPFSPQNSVVEQKEPSFAPKTDARMEAEMQTIIAVEEK